MCQSLLYTCSGFPNEPSEYKHYICHYPHHWAKTKLPQPKVLVAAVAKLWLELQKQKNFERDWILNSTQDKIKHGKQGTQVSQLCSVSLYFGSLFMFELVPQSVSPLSPLTCVLINSLFPSCLYSLFSPVPLSGAVCVVVVVLDCLCLNLPAGITKSYFGNFTFFIVIFSTTILWKNNWRLPPSVWHWWGTPKGLQYLYCKEKDICRSMWRSCVCRSLFMMTSPSWRAFGLVWITRSGFWCLGETPA